MVLPAILVSPVCGVVAGQTTRKHPPNIVLILADDLGAEQLACYGHKSNRTPNLDRLARGGTMFKTCWATPLCSPSRVELMTGRYGFRTGWFELIGGAETPSDHLDPDEITFGDVLKSAGYATGLAGKWQLGSFRKYPKTIFENGFDAYCIWAWASLPEGANFPGSPRQRYWYPAVIQDGRHRPTGPDDYGPDVYRGWLIDFMKANKDRPFLAYYPMCLVHEPWDPTPDENAPGGKTKGGLRACVEYMDKEVGRIVAAIDELGLRDETIILFTGDNGTGRAGKGTVTERGVRVPMIVSGPRIKEGYASDALIDFSDMLPTLAELTGAHLPEKVAIDGHSFVPALRGGSELGRDWIFSYLGRGRMIRDRRWLLEGNGKLFDCGENRDGTAYKDVTSSSDPDAATARTRFQSILRNLPAPSGEKQQPKQPRARKTQPSNG